MMWNSPAGSLQVPTRKSPPSGQSSDAHFQNNLNGNLRALSRLLAGQRTTSLTFQRKVLEAINFDVRVGGQFARKDQPGNFGRGGGVCCAWRWRLAKTPPPQRTKMVGHSIRRVWGF